MKIPTVVLAAALAGTVATNAWPQTPSDPVTIDDPVYSPEHGGSLTLTVHNHSEKTVTAWEVRVLCTYADGVIRGYGAAQDGYAAYAGALPARSKINHVMEPGQSAEVLILVPRAMATPIISMQAAVEWVVFADTTIFGDRAAVAELFRRRALDQTAWLQVISALEEGQRAGGGAAGVQLALNRLSQPASGAVALGVVSTMRANLQMALANPGSADLALEHWLTHARERLQAATKHVRPDLAAN